MRHLAQKLFGRRRATARRKSAAALPTSQTLEARRLLSVAVPTGVTATGVSASAILVQWNPSPDPTVSGYDVFAKTIIASGGGKGSRGGRTVYTAVATNVSGTSDTVSGLATGSTHTYVVSAVSPMGVSGYSAAVSAETWAPPTPAYGSEFLLSSGAVFSAPLSVTAGLTTQITLLAGGNPLMYSVQSGPPTISVNQNSGVVTYTPDLSEVGPVTATFKISNPLGWVTQSVQFDVVAPNPNQATPKLTLSGTVLTYDGVAQGVSAAAVGADGVTPVPGTFAFAYNGGPSPPVHAGTYGVLATFTSSDANYGNATVVGTMTIGRATPVFSALSSPAVASFALPGDANLDGKVNFTDLVQVARHYGMSGATWANGDFNNDGAVRFDDLVLLARNYGHSSLAAAPPALISGRIGVGSAVPVGEDVVVTLNGMLQVASVDSAGNFSVSFPSGSLLPGTYRVSCSFAGNPNFNPAASAAGTLTVVPAAPPQVTSDPKNVTTTAGDVVTLTAEATGSPPPTVQWQLSTDGGLTFADIYGATSNTYSFASNLNQNGYQYRAVFSNPVGAATTSAAVLTVQPDTGGAE